MSLVYRSCLYGVKTWRVPLIVALLASSSCTTQASHRQADEPDFVWVRVGTNPQGCAQFAKKATQPNRVADTAIWYRDAQGRYVLDAGACAPEKPQSRSQKAPSGTRQEKPR